MEYFYMMDVFERSKYFDSRLFLCFLIDKIFTLHDFNVLSRLGTNSAATKSSFFINSTANRIGISSILVFNVARRLSRGTITASFFFLPRAEMFTCLVSLMQFN